MKIITKSAEETAAFAKSFLKEALKKDAGLASPLIFYLTGELGAGKTHFAKGLAEALGIADNITSPTFVLMKRYGLPKGYGVWGIGYRVFYHIDCYRIYDAEDARQIGLDKILENPWAIIAIEWAERIGEIVPRPYWEVKMEHAGEGARSIQIKMKNEK